MTKMNRRTRDRWCETLRSGKYDEGRGCLRSAEPDGSSRYDPFGILCDLSGNGEWERLHEDAPCWSYRYESDDWWRHVPPFLLQLRVELCLPAVVAITRMADEGMSHTAIADWIEQHL